MSLRVIYLTVDVGLGTVFDVNGFAFDFKKFKLVAGDSNSAVLRITFKNTLPDQTDEGFAISDTAVKYLTVKMVTGTDSNGEPLFDDALLYLAEDEDWNVDGDWPERVAADGEHSVRINANQTPILEALAADGVGSIKAIFEVEIDDPDAGNSTLPSWQGLFVRQVHTGAEDLPETPDPDYATKVWVNAAISAALAAALANISIPSGKRVVFAIDGTYVLEDI